MPAGRFRANGPFTNDVADPPPIAAGVVSVTVSRLLEVVVTRPFVRFSVEHLIGVFSVTPVDELLMRTTPKFAAPVVSDQVCAELPVKARYCDPLLVRLPLLATLPLTESIEPEDPFTLSVEPESIVRFPPTELVRTPLFRVRFVLLLSWTFAG